MNLGYDYLVCPQCGTIADFAYWETSGRLACPVCDCQDKPDRLEGYKDLYGTLVLRRKEE